MRIVPASAPACRSLATFPTRRERWSQCSVAVLRSRAPEFASACLVRVAAWDGNEGDGREGKEPRPDLSPSHRTAPVPSTPGRAHDVPAATTMLSLTCPCHSAAAAAAALSRVLRSRRDHTDLAQLTPRERRSLTCRLGEAYQRWNETEGKQASFARVVLVFPFRQHLPARTRVFCHDFCHAPADETPPSPPPLLLLLLLLLLTFCPILSRGRDVGLASPAQANAKPSCTSNASAWRSRQSCTTRPRAWLRRSPTH